MIISGNLLVADDSGVCRLEPGTIRLEGETISEIQWGEINSKADHGGEGFLITPGFVDTHLHLPQFGLMGAHGMPLLRWLNECTFPAEAKWADASFAESMTEYVARQLLAHGTTTIAAYATVHYESVRAAIGVLQRIGLRGVVGQVLMNREAPDQLCRSATQLLDEASRLQEEFPSSPDKISAAVTPRFAISCTEDLLAGAGELASATGAIIQSHLAETEAEIEYVRELFGGKSYASVYQDAGLLNDRSIYGHGIHLSPQERCVISRSGVVIAHCPTANSFLRSGTMQRGQWLKEKIRLSIGSDIGAGYERSMVRVGRAMIEAASSIGTEFPSAAEAWYAITAGNAAALGLAKVGKIEIGAVADLVVALPDLPWLDGGADPLSMAMFAWNDRWVENVVLRGKPVLNAC